MEQWVQKAINSYSLLREKEAMFERHLERRENADMRDALAMVKMQIGAIESWFALLDTEERVIFRQVLLGDCDAATSNRIAATKWMQGLAIAGRSVWQIRENAIEKVVRFADMHTNIFFAVFENS